jgi:hypothetical protein
MVAKMPNRKYGYYRDDQIVFLVTHETDSISDRQLEDFSTKITTNLNGGIVKKLPRVFSFPKFTEQERKGNQNSLSADDAELFMSAFSIIDCNLVNGPDDPTELMDIVSMLNQKLQGQTVSGLTIQLLAPNWLASVASSDSGGTGGRGRPPRPFYGNRKTASYRFNDLMINLHAHGLDGDGTGVDVVIFDTAPSGHDLVAARKEWPDHPIIFSLLGPSGKLRLYPASYDELLRIGNTSINDGSYRLTDHGLFVAGIIHSIAPKADIHLIEIMNHCGVGDFMSFVQGLQRVRTEIYDPERKLVINCSWILEFPRDDFHCRHRSEIGDPDADFERAVLEFSKGDQATPLMLEFLFNQFYSLGRQAIAAGGNDAGKQHARQIGSRYPAALRNVTEVQTPPKIFEKEGNGKYRTNVSSTLPIRPESTVIMLLGGQGQEGGEDEVLGVYIGGFPDGSLNVEKWAWWSGSSFAAPILTGAVAAVLSSSDQIIRTQDAIQKLYDSEIIKYGETDPIEEAMSVMQN